MHILKCANCKTYGLSVDCSCGFKKERVVPPRFSPEDKYAEYRRQAKLKNENKQ